MRTVDGSSAVTTVRPRGKSSSDSPAREEQIAKVTLLCDPHHTGQTSNLHPRPGFDP